MDSSSSSGSGSGSGSSSSSRPKIMMIMMWRATKREIQILQRVLTQEGALLAELHC